VTPELLPENGIPDCQEAQQPEQTSEPKLPTSPEPDAGKAREAGNRDAEDLGLLQRIAQHDESALAELFNRHHTRVINLAYRYLGNRDDSELIAQDVFIRIWRHAGKFRGSSQVWTWIHRIVVNLCLTFKSHKRLTTETLDESIPAEAGHQPNEIYARREQQAIVRHALESLPPEQRMALILSRYEELSYEEIAQAMSKSVPAVATIIFRAKESLRAKLLPYLKRGKISP
jgi:RNA polymerase sigma-70 factor (ECF subfamily)